MNGHDREGDSLFGNPASSGNGNGQSHNEPGNHPPVNGDGKLIPAVRDSVRRELRPGVQAGADRWPASEPDSLRAPYAAAMIQSDEDALPISRGVAALRQHWWKIVCFAGLAAAATYGVSTMLPPTFEAVATVDVDRSAPSGVVGREARQESGNADAEPHIATQVRLIQSDAVLRPVVTKLGDKEPALATARGAGSAPISLKALKVSRIPNTYLIEIAFRSGDPQAAAAVANAVAASYVENTYQLRLRSARDTAVFLERQLEELRHRMNGSELALQQYEKEMNVIDPEQKAAILSSRLLQLNTAYTTAQAERLQKEAALNLVRKGSNDEVAVAHQGQSLLRLEERVEGAREQFAMAKATYGQNHPEYAKAATRLNELLRQVEQSRGEAARRSDAEFRQALDHEQMLQATVRQTKAEFDRINARSSQYQALKRSAEEDKKLYEELVRRIREAGINAGFQNGSVRVVDAALPPQKPVSPNAPLNGALALIGAGILGTVVVLARTAMDSSLRHPEQVDAALNTGLIAALPAVRHFAMVPFRVDRPALADPSGRRKSAEKAERDLLIYQEAIRTLRNSLLPGSHNGAPLKSVLITSAVPGEGKSTAAAHLAVAASVHRKTLLIDADLRRPALSRRFGLSDSEGLFNALSGDGHWRDYVIPVPEYPNLEVLVAGKSTAKASDLIGPRMRDLLRESAELYDLVIIDAPPVLGFAETLEIASAVDGVVIVALAGATNRKVVASALAVLDRLRARVLGVVLNQAASETAYFQDYASYTEAPLSPGAR